MIFKIKSSENETISLTEEQLFTQILAQAFKDKNTSTNVEDYISTINSLITKLNQSNLDITFKQIYTIYFLSGYYYKVFLSKNNVEINKKEK
jgi:ABC-type amino acid transport substrate-binding protein